MRRNPTLVAIALRAWHVLCARGGSYVQRTALGMTSLPPPLASSSSSFSSSSSASLFCWAVVVQCMSRIVSFAVIFFPVKVEEHLSLSLITFQHVDLLSMYRAFLVMMSKVELVLQMP